MDNAVDVLREIIERGKPTTVAIKNRLSGIDLAHIMPLPLQIGACITIYSRGRMQ